MSNQKCFTISTFCLVMFSQNLFSQIVLQGTVTDEESLPVQNALVEIKDQVNTVRNFSDFTNEQGQYIIQFDNTTVNDGHTENPATLNLLQNYPNPFNPATVIEYELGKPAHVTIEIYNVLGQKIKILFDGFQSKRTGRLVWDATDDLGQGVSAGVYIYSLRAEGIRMNKKMLLMDGNQGYAKTTDEVNSDVLHKHMSNQYLLRVTGNNIETYEQQNFDIVSNMVFDIKVKKATVTDIDGNSYRIIKIGNQWWMAENLKVTKYRSGDVIPNITDGSEWASLSTGAYSNYNDHPNLAAAYGRLYNWYVVNDSRIIAPSGWHVPSDEEWKQLEIYLGMSRSEADGEGDRGTDEGGKLKEAGAAHWYYPDEGATNESGFSALPGGYRNPNNGEYASMGDLAIFWSSTEGNSDDAWYRYLQLGLSDVYRYYWNKHSGLSVRLVRDNVNGNVAPIAFFSVNPSLGTTETNFNFDASGCSDNEDMISALQVRWDWENDKNWDTGYSTTKTTTYQYSIAGSKTIKMEVRDSGDFIDTFTQSIIVIASGSETGTVTDIDGNLYQTIKIGTQWWMAENLKVTHYQNGDAIPDVTDNSEWSNLTTGAYCVYDNDRNKIATYGCLYNWYAVNDSCNIAPAGWHVPSDEEWKQLEMYLGMSQSQADGLGVRGTDEGGKLKETGNIHWLHPNTGATNESGFSALPGGYRDSSGYYFGSAKFAQFWASIEHYGFSALLRRVSYDRSDVYRKGYDKHYGFSVRCLMDSVGSE